MDPAWATALAALLVAVARELRWLLEQRQRRRGELRTRDEDHP